MSRKLFSDYLNQLSYTTVYNEYIVNNKTGKECCEIFNVGISMFMRILDCYKIKKPIEAHVKNIKKSKKDRYGDENFNNEDKRKKTNIKKYGVANQFQRKELFPEIQQLKVEKYGTYNNIDKNLQTRITNSGSLKASYQKQQETYKATCTARCGVINEAMTDEIKNKIKDSLTNTFNELYGVNNYFELSDAKRSNGSKNSKANIAFAKKLTENYIDFEQEYLLDGKWFDFKINDLLIEIDPTATHNITWSPFKADHSGIDKNYHKNKTNIAIKHEKQCIHVFDWDDYDKIINLVRPKKLIYARDCDIKEISAIEAFDFLNKYHLQGYAKDKIRIGLFYNNKLVSLMTFGKPRYNKAYEYELIRYCNSNYKIVGGADKLFKYFIRQYQPKSIISYCDISKFNGAVYEKLKFKQIRQSSPSCHWYNIKTKRHITDNLIRQQGFDRLFGTDYGKNTSNDQLLLEAGFVAVYDCGQKTYGWHNS